MVPRKQANKFTCQQIHTSYENIKTLFLKMSKYCLPISATIYVKMPWGGLGSTICSLERTCHIHSMSACIRAHRQVTQPSGASKGGSQRSLENSAGKPVPYLRLSKCSNFRWNKVYANGPRKRYFSSSDKLTVFH